MPYTIDKIIKGVYLDEETKELCFMDKDAILWFNKNFNLD